MYSRARDTVYWHSACLPIMPRAFDPQHHLARGGGVCSNPSTGVEAIEPQVLGYLNSIAELAHAYNNQLHLFTFISKMEIFSLRGGLLNTSKFCSKTATLT